jgi:hypothetical protein
VTCAGTCKVKGCSGSDCRVQCQVADGSTQDGPPGGC